MKHNIELGQGYWDGDPYTDCYFPSDYLGRGRYRCVTYTPSYDEDGEVTDLEYVGSCVVDKSDLMKCDLIGWQLPWFRELDERCEALAARL